MMQFIYLLTPTRLEMLTDGPTPEEQTIVGEHLQHLQRLAAEGVALHFGRTTNDDERTVGIVVFQAADLKAAERVVQSDPAIRGEVMRAELLPYRQVYPA